MTLANYYWCFPEAVPTRICDEIVKYGKSLQNQMGTNGAYGDPKKLNNKQIKDLKKKRDSEIVWLNDRWIYNEIHPLVRQANRDAQWNYEWDWSEACQFTKYNKGQYYDWHYDAMHKPYNHPNRPTNGKIRKLSVTLSLSGGGKDYTGGELEFDFRNNDPDKKRNVVKCKGVYPKGSLVVFPGFVWHRVCPVKSGSRYSLVVWNLGWPYR